MERSFKSLKYALLVVLLVVCNQGQSFADPIQPGNILISNHGGNNIQLLDPTTGTVTTLLSVSSTPIGLAFDGSNNLYINVDQGIQVYNPTTATLNTSFFTGIGQREGLAFDSVTQNLFSVSYGANRLEQVDLSGHLVRTITIPGSQTLLGVTARGGKLIVTDLDNGNIYLATTTNPTVFTTIGVASASSTYGVDIDSSGDIFVNDFNGLMDKFHFNGSTWTKSIFINTLNTPANGLSIGDDGSFTISQFGANTVSIFNSDGTLRHNYTGVDSPDELVVFAPIRSSGGGPSTSPVPEPGSITLLASGLIGLGAMVRGKLRRIRPGA